MKDPDDEVRNWATFALGQQTQYDSTEIRDAIRERLSDTFEDARDEAVWALAIRHDPQGLRLLLDRLEAVNYKAGDEYAACDTLGVSVLNPDVDDLRDGLRTLLG
jgi:HEAT repeat protein